MTRAFDISADERLELREVSGGRPTVHLALVVGERDVAVIEVRGEALRWLASEAKRAAKGRRASRQGVE